MTRHLLSHPGTEYLNRGCHRQQTRAEPCHVRLGINADAHDLPGRAANVRGAAVLAGGVDETGPFESFRRRGYRCPNRGLRRHFPFYLRSERQNTSN